ncbi:MAG TPA: hypothetical protein DEV81_09485 [Cyanobacteria bacterium UBA11049]|nr:hypothetical protein [Cyanobacteria bacterium UBA11049]
MSAIDCLQDKCSLPEIEPTSVSAVVQWLWGTKAMLEKLLLAVTITLCLKLFLGVSFSTANPTTSGYQLFVTPTPSLGLLFFH